MKNVNIGVSRSIGNKINTVIWKTPAAQPKVVVYDIITRVERTLDRAEVDYLLRKGLYAPVYQRVIRWGDSRRVASPTGFTRQELITYEEFKQNQDRDELRIDSLQHSVVERNNKWPQWANLREEENHMMDDWLRELYASTTEKRC